MKNCKLVITKKCNLKCSYCCMKNPKILQTFQSFPSNLKDKDSVLDYILNNYTSVTVTGGEPFVDFHRIYRLIANLEVNKDYLPKPKLKAIYVYTNGLLIESDQLKKLKWFSLFKGLNISYHYKHLNLEQIAIYNQIIPVRLWVQDSKITSEITKFCKKYQISLKIWTKDDCDPPIPEDRYFWKF
jgi:molybdenum cofactor biosynthesis enzyme MoaA